ncbi:helix-turn-helix transcriptional regulator [Paenibacillus gansuensis]|uniref:Helix-turn-helix transcriptional regulator n=1 Tax=Paenibacillus gansuensis TaxID=306542 RepID=A0ABW5P9E5_9BACL
MKVLELYRSRKYLQKIMLSITMLLLISLSVSFTVLYFKSERTALDIQFHANQRVLNQVNSNISFINDVVQNLAVNLYNDNEIASIIYSRTNEPIDLIRVTNKINKTIDSTSFVHSVVLYRGQDKATLFQSDINIAMNEDEIKSSVLKYMNNNHDIRKYKLFPLNLYSKDGGMDVFSYVIFDSLNTHQPGEPALILNIKPQWLFNNLGAMNENTEYDAHTLLLNQEGLFYTDRAFEMADQRQIISIVEELKSGPMGFRVKEIGGKKSIVSFQNTDVNDWMVVTIQPYDNVMKRIIKMRTTFFYISFTFIIASVLMSIWISHKLYVPVNRLLAQIKGQEAFQGRRRDELTYVSEAFHQVMDKLNVVKDAQRDNQDIVKDYYLRRVITESVSFSKENWEVYIRDHDLQISSQDGPFIVCVMKMDRYKAYTDTYSSNERKLYTFALSNIIKELVSSRFYCECVDIRNEYTLAVISRRDQWDISIIETLLLEANRVFHVFYKLSFSTAMSREFHSHQEMASAYNQTLSILSYKLLFGDAAVIYPQMVEENLQSRQSVITHDIERKLSEGIKAGRKKDVQEAITDIFTSLRKYDYDGIISYLFHLLFIITNTLKEINSNRISIVAVDTVDLHQIILNGESLSDIEETFLETALRISEKHKNVDEESNDVLVETIKEVIESNYSDSNLSLQGISHMIKMSPAYVGRKFKAVELVSIVDFINDVRLRHASLLLESKNISINEVMERVGFSNASYFYRIFKKKYGSTPKEYRLKRSIG